MYPHHPFLLGRRTTDTTSEDDRLARGTSVERAEYELFLLFFRSLGGGGGGGGGGWI